MDKLRELKNKVVGGTAPASGGPSSKQVRSLIQGLVDSQHRAGGRRRLQG